MCSAAESSSCFQSAALGDRNARRNGICDDAGLDAVDSRSAVLRDISCNPSRRSVKRSRAFKKPEVPCKGCPFSFGLRRALCSWRERDRMEMINVSRFAFAGAFPGYKNLWMCGVNPLSFQDSLERPLRVCARAQLGGGGA